jgi:molybdate-binding protein/biotin operon repressor
MKTTLPLQTYEQIKCLADARRLQILRMLMSEPATLTQLGAALGKSPAWVQHHVRALETAGLVEVTERRVTGRVIEKHYRARAGAFVLQELILPVGGKPVLLVSGSHDLALEQLAANLAPSLDVIARPVGSLDGLVDLRQGLCHLSGAHLLDETGDYNTPTVRRLFPDRPVLLVTLAYRQQGLMLPAGNPKGIRSLADLTAGGITFVNRNPGSGTRLWLERQAAQAGLPLNRVRGHGDFVHTHTEAARVLAAGRADATLGLEAAARRHGLDFIPLFVERYDLVFQGEMTPALDILLNGLVSAPFRREMQSLPGYETAHTGEQIPL